MKNLRKEVTYGAVVLAIYLVLRIFFRSSGFLMSLLLLAGIILLVVGILPDELHAKVIAIKDKLLAGMKKK